MTTHIGREYEAMNAIDKLNLRLVKSDELVEYSDTTVTLFTYPAYTTLVAIIGKVTTAFDRPVDITLGDGTTADLFGQVSGRNAGSTEANGTLGTAMGSTNNAGVFVFWPIRDQTSAGSIIATLTARTPTGGTAPAAGVSQWFLVFRPLTADRNPNE